MPATIHTLARSLALCTASAGAQDTRPLLARYRGEVACPPALHTVHARLAQALAAGHIEGIRSCCLPAAVRIEKQPRKRHREYGQAINLPFAKTGFSPFILRLNPAGAGCMLVHTGSSHLRYVRTAKYGWRLYAYEDKPIR